MKVIAFSDVHGQYIRFINEDIPNHLRATPMPIIPECDVLIFAGDYSWASGLRSSVAFTDWFREQPGIYKILVPGNHDYNIDLVNTEGMSVLINQEVVIEGVKFFGSPYTPEFMGWNYMLLEHELEEMYSKFPEDIDVLITHGPPLGIMDSFRQNNMRPSRMGSKALLEFVYKIKPSHHVFGHNHKVGYRSKDGIEFHNVSLLNQDYRMSYPLSTFEV